jgi:hypothetical protein
VEINLLKMSGMSTYGTSLMALSIHGLIIRKSSLMAERVDWNAVDHGPDHMEWPSRETVNEGVAVKALADGGSYASEGEATS